MLLVGIPIIDDTSRWLFVNVLANFNLSLADWFSPGYWTCNPECVPTFFGMLKPLLLGFFYFHVRRLGRTTLSLLWAYAFVNTAFWIAVSLPLGAIDPEWWYKASWSWLYNIQMLIQLFILIWFARQASKFSFSHALVLLVLSIYLFDLGQLLSNLVFALLEDRAVAWDTSALALVGNLFALWVLLRLGVPREKHETDIERWIGSWDIPFYGAALRRLAVRILPRFDPVRGISKELLVALFGLYLLPQAYVTLRYWDLYRFETADSIATTVVAIADTLVAYLYTPLLTVLVILLAYVLRVDEPKEDSATIEPKAKLPKPFLCPSYGSQERPTFPATRGAETTFAEDIWVDRLPTRS